VTRLRAGRQRFHSLFFFATASRPDLGPIKLPVQWVSQALSPGIKRPRRGADHSPSSSVEIKNAWSSTSTPPRVFMAWYLIQYRIRLHGVVLRLAQGKFTTYLYIKSYEENYYAVQLIIFHS